MRKIIKTLKDDKQTKNTLLCPYRLADGSMLGHRPWLGFVPDKTQVVISINPQKMLRSAGGDWTEADGIVRGPYIDDLLNQVGEHVKFDENADAYLKIKGLNPESVIVASGNNFNSWYMLGAVTDKNLLTDYISNVCDMKIENKSGFDAVNLAEGACLLIDNTDQLLWMVTERDSDDAVRFVKNIKSRAADKSMSKWAHKYLGSGDNYFSAMGNFSAMGVNLNGLMRMMNVPADMLGGDISYMVLTAGESGHKASVHLMTLDAEGKNVPLFNERFYKSADLSAWNRTGYFRQGSDGRPADSAQCNRKQFTGRCY